MHRSLKEVLVHINIIYHLITLFPLRGKTKIKKPMDIGKPVNIVNQGKEFVVKTRYTWTRKTHTRKKNSVMVQF